MSLSGIIRINAVFWKGFVGNDRTEKLLIEKPSICFITHLLCVQSLIVCKANRYYPVWMNSQDTPIELLKSYDPLARYLADYKLNFFEKLASKVSSLYQYAKMKYKKNILSFSIEGVKYGDIVYDSFLSKNKVGTIKTYDKRLYDLIFICTCRHKLVKKIILNENISAVLVAHRVGFSSGILYRTALKYGCRVFTSAGMDRNTIHVSNNISEMIEYGYKPTPEEIDEILSLSNNKFDELYNFVNRFHITGNGSGDAKYAFSEENQFFDDKGKFAKAYALDNDKKNIFVMLHAFTDYPHSHFNSMIFKDYADWFLKTLEFAKTDEKVNWIFKQHPSDEFYPTSDICFKEIFKNAPNNVLFFDRFNQLDTRSLIHISDAIVTCLGSAGFEIPAMGGVPSITAGESHYHGFDFSLNPKTEREYFDILRDLSSIKTLTIKQQRVAKAIYIFVHYLATVNNSAIPVLSMAEHRSADIDAVFWDRVLDLYSSKKEKIFEEMDCYCKQVEKNNFKALRTSPSSFECSNLIAGADCC